MSQMLELNEFVGALQLPDSFDDDWLRNDVFTPLGLTTDEGLTEVCEDIIIGAADITTGELHMRPGGWRINLSASIARTLLAGAIVGSALLTIGADQVPLELLPAVLPLLVDIEKVSLDRRDRQMLIPLKLAAEDIEGIAVHPDVLYNRLDAGTRDNLNPNDFLAFTERLIEAGELDDAGYGDVRARPGGNPAWIRVSWK